MSTPAKSSTHGQAALRRYENYGFLAGLWLGVLLGVLYSGPNFHAWAASTSLLVIGGCAAGGAAIGFLAAGIVIGFAAGGPDLGGDGSSAGNDDTAGGAGGDGGGSAG